MNIFEKKLRAKKLDIALKGITSVQKMYTIAVFKILIEAGFTFEVEDNLVYLFFDGDEVQIIEPVDLSKIDYANELIELIFEKII